MPGSYFMVCGFRHGYFGIQEQANGRKVVLFSVWDPGRGDNPNQVPEKTASRCSIMPTTCLAAIRRRRDRRPELLRVSLESRRDLSLSRQGRNFPSPSGRAAKVRARPRSPAISICRRKRAWKHLVTFRTITGGTQLESPHSFIEDFRRDGKSATQVRRAVFGNGWVRDAGRQVDAAGESPIHRIRRVLGSQGHDRRRRGQGSLLSANRRRYAHDDEAQRLDRMRRPRQEAAGNAEGLNR